MKTVVMLESKYFSNDNAVIKIPVRNSPDLLAKFGNPHFAVEPQFNFYGQRKKKKAWITALLIRIPDLIKPGYECWRKIKCCTPRLLIDGNLRSVMISGCLDHEKPVIEFYPPHSAKFLIIDDLFSGMCMDIKWEGENGKDLNLNFLDFRTGGNNEKSRSSKCNST